MSRNLLYFIRLLDIWNLDLAVPTRSSNHIERPLVHVVLYIPAPKLLSNHPLRVVNPIIALAGIFANCDLHVIEACSFVADPRLSRIFTHLIVENLCLVGLRVPDADAGL